MQPYYQDDFITLYHGDCLQHLDMLDQADVMVTDPPYGMDFQSGQRKGAKLDKIKGDQDTTARDAVVESWGDRPALVFGRWSVAPPAGERQRLIWWKEGNPGMGDLSIPFGPAHEDIHLIGHGWDREATGLKRIGSVITTTGVRGGAAGEENQTGHPTPKPVPLMERLIERCPPGVIVDPFAGSGSTLRAAKNLGRKCIGFEIEEKYCEITAKRLAQEVLFVA